jgi:putative transposase
MSHTPHKHFHHEPPSWARSEGIYFVTVCAQSRAINQFCKPIPGQAILDSIRYRNQNQIWFCHLAVLMPDHIHLLITFPGNRSFSRIVGDWKKWLTQNYSISWQPNFFEHRRRNEENVSQKSEYILQNPIRAGLAQQAHEWPYTWTPNP